MSDWFSTIVRDRRDETQDIMAVELVAAVGAELPPFTAGSHIEVRLGDMIRHYSIASSPADTTRYLLGVLREPAGRGGSEAMHRDAGIGRELIIRGPHNNFPLAEEPGPVLLLAGGIGITPILAMAERLTAQGRPFSLHYCAKSPETMAFRDHIAAKSFSASTTLHFDSMCSGGRPDLDAILVKPDEHAHLYVCGPEPMIAAAVASAHDNGWTAKNIHVEHFAAPDIDESLPNRAFRVKISSTGRIVEVPPDQTVVEALRAAGIRIETSCSQGVCGFCITEVLEGIPEHRDTVLSEEEHESNTLFTPCCSRAKSDELVLDL